jgi:hypothetical protein
MAAYRGDLVKEALWPEVLGIGAYALGELALANLDAKIATSVKGYPVAQTTGTLAAIAGSVIAIGKNKAPEFSKGVLYGSLVGLVVNLARSLWDMARTGAPASTTVAQVAALIPMKAGTAALSRAQQQALLAARARAQAQAAGAAAPQPGIVQFSYE